jgi:hypothetical protein
MEHRQEIKLFLPFLSRFKFPLCSVCYFFDLFAKRRLAREEEEEVRAGKINIEQMENVKKILMTQRHS